MNPFRLGAPVDRPARDRAAGVVASLLDRSLPWSAVADKLENYSGRDRGVAVIHAELRSVAQERGSSGGDGEDAELDAVLRRTLRFLRSGAGYKWHDRGPVEIVGAYLGFAALVWMTVGGLGAILGFGHELVVAGALLAMLLMYVLAAVMALALVRRLWWRFVAGRDGASHRVWPFFTEAEYHSAGENAPASGEPGSW